MDRQIARQPAIALFCAGERHRIGPVRLQGFDESLGLAVGLRLVSPGARGFQPQNCAGLPPQPGAVGAAVVTQNATAGDALADKPGHSSHQKAHRRGPLLIRHDLKGLIPVSNSVYKDKSSLCVNPA